MEQLKGQYTFAVATMSMAAGSVVVLRESHDLEVVDNGGNGSDFNEINHLFGPKTPTVGMVRPKEKPSCLLKTLLDIVHSNLQQLLPTPKRGASHPPQLRGTCWVIYEACRKGVL